jgi:cob(I)alamin adenosyltransferase
VKIYTRTGDDGSTGLLGPGRVLKSDHRVEAYGTVDELNAVLGTVRSADAERWFDADLAAIQDRLFALGATLATTSPELRARLDRVSDEDVAGLEHTIDRLDADLPPLTQFILPGGTPLAAHLHHARTVCRRAERRVVVLGSDAADGTVVRYLNRLADLLFVMARSANHRAGRTETAWKPRPRA